jgi:hypothetical protein
MRRWAARRKPVAPCTIAAAVRATTAAAVAGTERTLCIPTDLANGGPNPFFRVIEDCMAPSHRSGAAATAVNQIIRGNHSAHRTRGIRVEWILQSCPCVVDVATKHVGI